MNVDAYLPLIPGIEKAIADAKLDTLVCGMGPTAWLLPWMDRALIAPMRLWGCHDACRILPMDDLVIMDSPHNTLHPDTTRYKHTVDARPKRLWIYEKNAKSWAGHIAPCMEKATHITAWNVCHPNDAAKLIARDPKRRGVDGIQFKLGAEPPHTTSISPTGMTTLAWREGGRRIGVIGVDMMKNHHHTYRNYPLVDAFFVRMAEQSHAMGGCVVNLSPITSLHRFKTWQAPSTSGSEPISGNATPEPSASSSTPSTSTPPATSRSTG